MDYRDVNITHWNYMAPKYKKITESLNPFNWIYSKKGGDDNATAGLNILHVYTRLQAHLNSTGQKLHAGGRRCQL